MGVGIKYTYKLARPLPYDGEKVWNGEWFAGIRYPAVRCLPILEPCEFSDRMRFPLLLNAKRWRFPTIGVLGQRLWEYVGSSIVLDGTLVIRDGDELRFDHRSGQHVHPHAVLMTDDVYSLAVFRAGTGSHDFSRRRKRLEKIVAGIDSPAVQIVPYKRIENRKTFDRIRLALSMQGYGMTLRRDVPYAAGRTGDILKIGCDS